MIYEDNVINESSLPEISPNFDPSMIMASAKKRKASTAAGSPPKKRVIDNKSFFLRLTIAEKKAQRKRPVTSTRIDEDSDVTDDERSNKGEWEGAGSSGDDLEEMENGEAEFEDTSFEDEEMKDDKMNIDKNGKNKSTEKDPKNVREAHKAQKALQRERRAAKQHSDVLSAAKPLWERARQKDVTKEQKAKDINALMGVVRGRVQDVVLKHDASRIVQTLVKYGNQEIRDEVANELKGKYRELARSKYSKFLVTKLIRLCPKHRSSILLEFRGHVVRLLLHREASSVIADAFELYANAFERALLLYDFYGKEVALFSAPALAKGANADEKEKEQLNKGLKGVLEGADLDRKKRILAAVKENLLLVINNPEKGSITHAIFHRVLWEYLSQINELQDDDLQEKMRREIFEACQEQSAEMVHTKDGSRVVREFIVQGTAKDRKQIVKMLKPHIERMCKDDEAQNVLFTALDVIDDTKLTGKSIVAEVTSRASDLYTSPQGRRALFYLLVPRSSRHFTPTQTALLAETDAIRARTSKKDEAVRRAEILKAASQPLISLLEDKTRAEEMIRDPGGSLLVTEIMLYAEDDKSKAIDSLLCLVNEPYPASDPEKPHIIDVPHASRALKTLLQGGHFSQSTKSVVRAPQSAYSPVQFAQAWLNTVERERTRSMALAGGTFVVAALAERICDEGLDSQKEMAKQWFDKKFVGQLKDSDVKGKKVLLNVLES